MKYRKRRSAMQSRKYSLSKQAVRVPKDYPWRMLSLILEGVRQYLQSSDVEKVERVIRSRSLSGIMKLGAEWSLQQCCSASPLESSIFEWEIKVMLGGLIKKYQFPSNQEVCRQAAFEAVRDGEEQCRKFNIYGYKVLLGKPTTPVLKYAREFCERVLGPVLPDTDRLTSHARHGPGATTSTAKGNTSVYFKYAEWPYPVTARCYLHTKNLILSDQRWLGALEDSYRRKMQIPMHAILDWDSFWDSVLVIVDSNKITSVSKDALKDRPIAIEPSMNMMLQLGVDGYIRRRLKSWGIDLDSQFKNQVLAQAGSIRVDDFSPATIDLASASDTISLRVCKLLLPREWYEHLCDLRSPRGLFPDGERLRYRKISSMGNGGTFAVESLIFASIVYGVSKWLLGKYPRDDIAIFGDDIVVPECISREVAYYLERFGFSVNKDKSFLTGLAKESCGTDWYRGHPMRGVFIKNPPRSVRDLFSDRNRLLRWCVQHSLPSSTMEKVDSAMRSWIPAKFHTVIGPYSDEEFDSYWHTDSPNGFDQFTGYDPERQTYTIWSLSQRPKRLSRNEFLFRKLMAPLRQGASKHGSIAVRYSMKVLDSKMELDEIITVRDNPSGSSFVIQDAYCMRSVAIRRTLYNWSDAYRDPRNLVDRTTSF